MIVEEKTQAKSRTNKLQSLKQYSNVPTLPKTDGKCSCSVGIFNLPEY